MLKVLEICRKNNGKFTDKFAIEPGESNLFAGFDCDQNFYTLMALCDGQGIYELIKADGRADGLYEPCWRRMPPSMLDYMQSLRNQLKEALTPYKLAANKERAFCAKMIERSKSDQLSELRKKLAANRDLTANRACEGEIKKALHNRLIFNNLAKNSKKEYARIVQGWKIKRDMELKRLNEIAPFYNFPGGYVDFKCRQHIDAFNACASTFS